MSLEKVAASRVVPSRSSRMGTLVIDAELLFDCCKFNLDPIWRVAKDRIA